LTQKLFSETCARSGTDACIGHARVGYGCVPAAALVILSLLSSLIGVQAAGAPIVVGVSEERPIIELVPLTGTVNSPRVARLSPEVAGRVRAVLVDAGDRVEAGSTVLQLDPTLSEIDREAAQAATAQAREELADARRRLKDAERLVKSRGVAETEVEARRSEVRADLANLNLRIAEQRREEERVRRHTVTAPFSGVISRKLTESGEWISPGDEVLELVADAALRVDFQVPQAYFSVIEPGTPIELKIDSLPGQVVPEAISEVIPVSDPAARTFQVRVRLDDASLPLTPGMSASGLLRLGGVQKGVVVARDALLRHPDGRVTVWVVEQQDDAATVSERLVQTGPAFEGRVMIREGLEAGTRVVIEGNEALRQGQRVTIRAVR
jgi:RND family efflux transporter MFP subunit